MLLPRLDKTGREVRVHVGSDETLHIVADVTPDPYVGAFSVTPAGPASVNVGLGLLDNVPPTINRIRLDGQNTTGDTVRVPAVELAGGPNDQLRSWVCLRAVVDLSTGKISATDPEARTIVHTNMIAGKFENGFSPDDGRGAGYLVLALVIWQDRTTIKRIIQNVFFNQVHTFKKGKKGGKGFHFFHPAA